MPSLLKARGLSTFKNKLQVPEGSLLTADNIVIDQDNIIMPRRGFKSYSCATSCCTTIKQTFEYKNRVIRHYGAKLEYDCCSTNGSFSAFNGCYTEPETGIRIKSVEANSNLYFTTNDGIKKIDGTLDACGNTNFTTAANFIQDSGAPKALDVTGVVSYSCGAFLTALSKVAYRIVWGYKDNNNNLIIGAPSSRLVIANSACCTATVCLTFSIPSDANTVCYFYQIYRTGITSTCCSCCLSCIDPGDEMNLVLENNLTAANITAGTITINDPTIDSFRASGAILYTNPVSGDGILQANDKPPKAKDVAKFRNSVFFANTSTIENQQFNLLSVASLTTGNSNFVIGNGCTTRTYTFRGATEVTEVTAIAYNCAAFCDGDYILVNSASNERKYGFWFSCDPCACVPCACDLTGRILVKTLVGACDNAATVACKLQTTITAQSDFTATVCCAVVTITNVKNGNTTDATNGASSPGFSFCVTTQGDGECSSANDVLLSSLTSAAQSIDESARSLVSIINQDCCGIVEAFYLSGEDDLPGIIRLEAKNLSDCTFYIAQLDDCADISGQFCPSLPKSQAVTSFAAACSCTKTLVTMPSAHGFLNCNTVYIYCTTNCTDGTYTVSAAICCACCCTFTFKVTGTLTETSARVFLASQASDNETAKNRLYFSKTSQPEAVPLTNYVDLGGKDKAIERIVALRDNLFALKEDGIYIVTGESAPNFTTRLLDGSIIILAPDSASVLNNQIYLLSTQGIAAVSDTGVGVVSRDIEDKILEVTKSNFNFRTASFGISSESDRSYHIWLPTTASDTIGTQAYRYNTFTKGWVRWTICANAGLVNSVDDKIYLAKGAKIHQERKNDDRTDHADDQFCLTIPSQCVVACTNQLVLSSVSNVTIGDVITQCQCVTVAKFNRLLRKLDTDSGLTCTNYFSVVGIDTGNDLSAKMSTLVTKLNADITGNLTVAAGCINTGTDVFTEPCHSLGEGERLVITSACTSPTTCPAGLLDCCDVIYAKCVTQNTFKVSTTSGGSAINVTAAGCGNHIFTPTFSTPSGGSFAQDKTDFNTLTTELNNSAKPAFSNYASVCDTVQYEGVITAICTATNKATIDACIPFLKGSIIHFKGICSQIEWSPQHFGDPSVTKQVPEGSIQFDGNNFYSAEISYKTDLSQDFDEKEFLGRGVGYWGSSCYNCTTWGGCGTDVPIRTLVPKNKQRCRYIFVKFRHFNAREDWRIVGISLEPRRMSTRGYKRV